MDKQKYESNSKLHKDNKDGAEKKIEKVVTGTVKQAKKSLLMSFFEKDIRSVGRDILTDTLIPELKKAISDIIKRVTDGATDMLFYGESTNRSNERRNTASRISYRSYYDQRENSNARRDGHQETSGDYYDLIFSDRKDVEDIIDRMHELIDRYGIVSIGDLYDMANVKGPYTNNKYGWTDISTARIDKVRDGFMLRMPRAMPIN